MATYLCKDLELYKYKHIYTLYTHIYTITINKLVSVNICTDSVLNQKEFEERSQVVSSVLVNYSKNNKNLDANKVYAKEKESCYMVANKV